jgi:hypothetical protein
MAEPTEADRALAEQMKQGLLPTKMALPRIPVMIALGLLPADFVLPPPVSPEYEN